MTYQKKITAKDIRTASEAVPDAAVNTMWGGRFSKGANELLEAINASIDFDHRLGHHDVIGSCAHCRMLAQCGIITAEEAETILAGLARIETEIATGTFPFSRALEDIHMNIEARLRDHIGPTAGKLHTARSRNDQVATDLRLYIRDAIDTLDEKLWQLRNTLLDQAEQHVETLMPGFTHLQIAQPVTFGFYCLAYVCMFDRDRTRFADARRRLNFCPLGSAALAGTPHPIDREQTARELGFAAPMDNALDGVSDRDFALETLAAAGIAALHLSRLAEELVMWSSPIFGFIRMPEQFSTGSSIMPQKRNPDAAELVRGKSGRVLGSFYSLATVLKGLPLGYSKDMQEDKEPVFDALDTLELCLAAASGMIAGLTICTDRMAEAAAAGHATATDIADWLTSQGMPFREAHHIVGRLVAAAEQAGGTLNMLPHKTIAEIAPLLTDRLADLADPRRSVAARNSYGGTAPTCLREAIRKRRETAPPSGVPEKD